MAEGQAARLKAGEYEFAPSISARDAAALIASGRTVVRRITMPEGITTAGAGAAPRRGRVRGGYRIGAGRRAMLPDTYDYSGARCASGCWRASAAR